MKKQTQRTIGILLVIVLAGSAVTAWWFWGRQKPLPEGLIQANGRIEGDHYTVASKVAGRIVRLLAHEGDSVKMGQTLLNLDDVQIRARVEQARAAVEASKAQLRAARTDLATLKKAVPLKIDTARSGVVHAEMPVSPVVEVQGFCKRYRRQAVVQGVDLGIQQGEIYGLIGPDGAGKSSLMKAIAGVLTYEGGTVDVFGVRVDSEAAAEQVKERIGFMPQGLGLNLYAELSVEEI